ncbi:MAG: glutathione S-transferase N-terminal domain-containing protein [Myxococcota bacterium]
MPLPRPIDVGMSWLSSGMRLGGGLRRGPIGPRPETPLIVYEFEACPWCRRVREALTVLDLVAEIRPCPKNGPRFREAVKVRGGRAMFPYLVDPNTDVEMYESADIVRYLFERYGDGPPPASLVGPLFPLSSQLASLMRLGMGAFYRGDPKKAPEQPMVLYGMEASPYTRIVREALCELELSYLLQPTPTKGQRWGALRERSGKAMVPYLIDPNTGTEMHESADIRDYLVATYG